MIAYVALAAAFLSLGLSIMTTAWPLYVKRQQLRNRPGAYHPRLAWESPEGLRSGISQYGPLATTVTIDDIRAERAGLKEVEG